MGNDFQVIRVLKEFKTENAVYNLGEVYGVRGSLAKEFVRQGLAEIVEVDDDEEDDSGDDAAEEQPAWNDPELGTFHHDDFAWTTKVSVPAFKVFKFRKRRKKAGKSGHECKLMICTDTPQEVPTPEAISLAKKVLANQVALVPQVANALWDDFAGTGPDSGMYWHGDLDQVAEGMESGEPPRSVQDLYALMRLTHISIRQNADGPSDELLVELNFRAAFEDEHGVGFLTDGESILGIGYAGDMKQFGS